MRQKLKRRIWKWRGVLIIAPSVAGLVIAASSVGFFQLWEWVTYDHFFRLRPREPVEQALFLYTMNSFREATKLLQDCLKITPRDTVAQIYLERCQQIELVTLVD